MTTVKGGISSENIMFYNIWIGVCILDLYDAAKITMHYARWRQNGLNNLQMRYATPIEIVSLSQNHDARVHSSGTLNITATSTIAAMKKTAARKNRILLTRVPVTMVR